MTSAHREFLTDFVFQTSEAADKCMNEKRKTIGGEDILTSMQALGFDNYAGVMKVYLSKFRVVSPDPSPILHIAYGIVPNKNEWE